MPNQNDIAIDFYEKPAISVELLIAEREFFLIFLYVKQHTCILDYLPRFATEEEKWYIN